MEKKIDKKIHNYITNYKENIKNKAIELGLVNKSLECNNLIQYIYDYENLKLTKEDFMKRKRCKNTVNIYDRCIAKRANGESCSRKKKEGCEYCGTHIKGTPHGIVDTEPQDNSIEKIEVFIQEIKGIMYYIDNKNNVYDNGDILKNINNPKIIAKYTKTDGVFHIPEFNI